MPRRRGRSKKVNWGFTIVVSLLFAATILVTLSEEFQFEYIPTWDELFAQSGLSDPVFTEAELSVHVIDVGQGDSILIRSPEHDILIDASEAEYGPSVASYLRSQGVDSLDYVVATHPHADHIGGLAYVIGDLEVRHVIAPQVPKSITPTSKAYRTMLEAIKAKGLTIEKPEPGMEYDLGDGAGFTIVGPAEPSDEMNNNSVVLRLTYKDTSFLFTGDSEKDMERLILDQGMDLSADVLKVGHHGSNTSTGAEFLRAVGPRYAAISCGVDNSYGHPHRETMERLKQDGVKIYRTDLDGTIVFESDGKAINVLTAGKQAA